MSLYHLPSRAVLRCSGRPQRVSALSSCRGLSFCDLLFRGLTFSVKHLGDVQELLSHLEGSVQVTNRVVLQADTLTVRHTHAGLHWVYHETTNLLYVIRERRETEMGFTHSIKISFIK